MYHGGAGLDPGNNGCVWGVVQGAMGIHGGEQRIPSPYPQRATPLTDLTPLTQAGDDNELDFQAGDTIRVISKPHDDWWEGSCEGRTGLFPSSYVGAFVPGSPGASGAPFRRG